MFGTKETTSTPTTFDLIHLVEDYHKVSEHEQKRKAHQFAYALIDLYNQAQTVLLKAEPLTGQLLNNFLMLINRMIQEEMILNQQVETLKQRLTGFSLATHYEYAQDLNWIGKIYNTYFAERLAPIYDEHGNYYALFSLVQGNFYFNTTFIQGTVEYYFSQVKNCQFFRSYRIAWALSAYFSSLSGHNVSAVTQFSETESWQNFLNSIPANKFYNDRYLQSAFWFHVGIKHSNTKMIHQWLHLGGQISDLDNTARRNILKIALELDDKMLFRAGLLAGVIPTQEEIALAKSNVKKLLNYRPGKKYYTLKEYLFHPECNADLLRRILNDESNTSDDESSDEELGEFQIVNKTSATGKYVLSRGIHYTPGFYKSQMRQQCKRVDSHNKKVSSRATADLATKVSVSSQPLGIEKADELIKSYFALLKLTPDKIEFDHNHKAVHRTIDGNKVTFASLYYHFIQAYVNSYNAVFTHGGMSRNFNFCSDLNPVLSITPSFEVACRYASGERINHSVRYFPKIRSCTGELKHNRLGFVEVYLLDPQYFQNHGANIKQLSDKKGNNPPLIGVEHNYSFNHELIIESSLPAESVLGFQLFSLPRMNTTWHPGIMRLYGLSQVEYDTFKARLRGDSAEIEKALTELIVKVTETQARMLQLQVDKVNNSNAISQSPDTSLAQITEGVQKMTVTNRP